ncbi:MAG: ATP-grasp domain-containing protein [Planctomycetia bacterium]|nr:ATP-grasp domain-containing protein [Planctomycetia bacterium]
MPTLILTPGFTPDAQALWQAAVRKGWGIERLERWAVPDRLRNVPEPVLYLEGLFGPTLAEAFGRELVEPPVDWLARLPVEHRRRRVELMNVAQARGVAERKFMKPPNDKSFPAGVYRGVDLPAFIEDNAPVLVSEIVDWEVEFRCFVLDRTVLALSVYLRDGELQRRSDFRHDSGEEQEVRA